MAISRAIGRVIIKRLVPQGLGSNAILRAIVKSGYSYRRQDMQKDVRQIAGLHKNEAAVRAVSGNEVVPRGYMVESDLKQPYKYKFYGKSNYYDPFTDSYTTKTESFYTDDLAKKSAWEDEYFDSFGQRCPGPKPELVNFNLTSVEHNKGYSY